MDRTSEPGGRGSGPGPVLTFVQRRVANLTARGSTFWLVSEFGRRAQYVRKLEADPRVRVQVGGVLVDRTRRRRRDDPPLIAPLARLRRISRINRFFVHLVGTGLMSVRVDLGDV